MKIALRIDVDTLRGTQQGVPRLMNILSHYGIRGAFFFSVGPDNMGRNLWRLLNPKFAYKMMRTNAVGLYGPQILLQGTFWRGKKIGYHSQDIIKACRAEGHEIGVHAWDHNAWQRKIDHWQPSAIEKQLSKAYDALYEITGYAPTCSAVPAWKCTNQVLLLKEKYAFRYNSDCRGNGIFLPVVDGKTLSTPQIPQSMPTYDELIGTEGIDKSNYNLRLLSFAKEEAPNLLAIHAEVEGGICAELFKNFIELSLSRGITFVSPESLLSTNHDIYPKKEIIRGTLPGREGWASIKL